MVEETIRVRRIRYGDFVHESNVHQFRLSYGDLIPPAERSVSGEELPYRPQKLKLSSAEVIRLLTPYVTPRFMDQVRAVVPLAIYLILFQMLILRENIQDSWLISGGLFAAIVGLMLFLEGLTLGLMPFGEIIGNKLPRRSPLWLVLLIAMILGIGVTFAEPAIGALQSVGSIVDVAKAPYLWLLLNEWAGALVLAVGAGVGIAAVLGTLRFLRGWSLKPCIYALVIPTLLLTAWFQFDPDLAVLLGLAWDCGAVTTGPVTVPLVLSLGIGIAAAAGKGRSSLSGFGIVTLASLFPIVGVLLLSLYMASTVSPDEVIEAAHAARSFGQTRWWERSPVAEIIGGIRAIVPLVLFLFLVFKLILHEKLKEAPIVIFGLALCVLGMVVFNLGLTYGLSALGEQSGGMIPAAFTSVEAVSSSPLYSAVVGVSIAALFAWILGFFATMAEPALNALGLTVENLTNGAFRKRTLMMAVSLGVGVGITLGVLKIIYAIPLGYLLLPGYTAGVILTYFSTEEFVNVAWDSAGVTTGPVTVPLVLAMGLGFGNAVSAVEGFGILAMASISPIISVLGTGIWVRYRARKADRALAEKTLTEA